MVAIFTLPSLSIGNGNICVSNQSNGRQSYSIIIICTLGIYLRATYFYSVIVNFWGIIYTDCMCRYVSLY